MWPILLHIGFLKIPAYGFMLGIGIMLGIHLARKEAIRQGVDANKIEGLAFWTVIWSVFASRFLYTFVEHGDYYWHHPLEFFSVQKGGLAFSGSFVAAILVIFIYVRKYRLEFWQSMDILTPPVSLGLMFGKIGCFLAGCCYGKVCDLPWGVTFTRPESLAEPKGVPLHPTQLYEALAWFILFWVLLFFRKKTRSHGEVFFLFGVVYGVGRFLLEYLRADPGHLGELTTAQVFSIPLVLFSVLAWVYRARKSN